MTLYECLFLVEAGRVSRNWEETEKELAGILVKHGAEIKQQTFYGERKLAYPVKKHRRGAYVLTYFEADPQAIEEMRRDLTLSEAALRHLILKVEGGVVPEERSLGTWEPAARPVPAGEPKGETPPAGAAGEGASGEESAREAVVAEGAPGEVPEEGPPEREPEPAGEAPAGEDEKVDPEKEE